MATLRTARIALAVVVAAIVAWGPFAADANHIDVKDPNDSRGRLDIRRVEVNGTRQTPFWKVMTYQSWSTREIFEKGFVLVFLDTYGKKRFDYYALVRSSGRKMRAALYQDRRRRRDIKVSRLHDWRANTRSVSVRIPLKEMRLGSRRLEYRWYAETLFTGNRCPHTCFDFAPDDVAVSEPHPDVTVTPSSSPNG